MSILDGTAEKLSSLNYHCFEISRYHDLLDHLEDDRPLSEREMMKLKWLVRREQNAHILQLEELIGK
jgi:hypothetical protein